MTTTPTTIWPRLERGRVIWTCTGCGKPIADGTGYIECDRAEALRRDHEQRREEARNYRDDDEVPLVVNFGDLLEQGPVQWLAWHRACDTDPDYYPAYWIAVERLRTPGHILHWTAHLGIKSWTHRTNWLEIAGYLGDPS